MKICYLVITSIVHASGIYFRAMGEIEQVAKLKKYKLTLIMFVPVNELLTRTQIMSRFKKNLSRQGVDVFLLPSLPSSRIVLWEHLRLCLGWIICFPLLLIKRPDILHAHSIEAGWITNKLKKFIPTISFLFEAHGLAKAEFENYGQRADRVKLVGEWEKQSVKEADAIVATSSSLLENLTHNYLPKTAQHIVVPSSVNLKIFNSSERQIIRRQLKIVDKFVIIYSGALQDWQAFDDVVALVEKLAKVRSDLCFMVLTKETKKARTMVANLKNIKIIIKELNQKRLAGYLAAGDLGIAIRKPNLTNLVASPTKFGEYLACGLPVIVTTAVAQINEVGRKYPEVIFKTPVNEKEMVQIKSRRVRISRLCRQCANMNYSWSKNIIKISKLYEEIKK